MANKNTTLTKQQQYSRYVSVPIPTIDSNAQYWIGWHKAIKKKFGKKTANDLFTTAWAKYQSGSANNKDTREYFAKQGITIQPNNFIERSADTVRDIGGAIGDVFTTGRTVMYVVGGITFVIVAKILWGLAKDPIKSAGAIADISNPGVKLS